MAKNWAIVIGINQYDNLQALHYAKRDAEAMHTFFQEAGFQQIYCFTDDSPPIPTDSGPALRSQPTFGTLSRFLRTRFERPFLEPGDNLWFFFAGHGQLHQNRDYLMPIDVDPGDIDRTAIRVTYVSERLRRCGADNVILMLDACRNESGRDGLGIGTETQQGVITFFACSPKERSYELDHLQQGAFTHALLEALRIRGAGNCATVERLYQHLRYRVPPLVQQVHKRTQTPYASVEPATKLHLILLPHEATDADVQTLKNDALQAEVEDRLDDAEDLWVRVLAVRGGDRQALDGIKRIARKLAASPTPYSAPPTPPSPSPPSPTPRDTSTPTSPTPPSALRTPDSAPPTPHSAPRTPHSALPTFPFEVVTVDDRGRETPRRPGQASYYREDLGNGISLDMVQIPGGSFQMGTADSEKATIIKERLKNGTSQKNAETWTNWETPQHRVTVPEFFMGKTPITQAQYQAIMGKNPSNFKGDKRPVETVSWNDAMEFCQKLSQKTGKDYRLPSEAEWEYACRAGTTTPFHFGATITPDLVNYDGNHPYGNAAKGKYRNETTEVGSFPPNGFGLYDLHGTVWEWCADNWHDNYNQAPTDGSIWKTRDFNNDRHVLRGGSWIRSAVICRAAGRIRRNPDDRHYNIGFRVVCVPGART